MSNIVFAKPGDAMWKLVSPGQASHWLFDYLGKVAFQSLVSIGGRCYFSSPEGSVYVLRLQPLPRLVEIVNQRSNKMSRDAYNQMVLFTGANGITGCIELIQVDIAGKRLVPLSSLGGRAVFVGETHCVAVSTKTFPSIAPDAIYTSYRQQYGANFGICHLSNMSVDPVHEFDRDKDLRLIPRDRPCNIDQYLVCYVDRRGTFSGACIIHAYHLHPFPGRIL
ncbi:hypothetical protein HU200_055796 [Digitaria exilis]|uniref:KIB1-4 beta-propeller domain-containing protein n=1 Tax=Digitaria exilis TaxID=1010633 RepID=A0A835AIP3_9POAL|nr:hypothetical protein HU200_055796 [Digitaria exilis]